MIIRGAPSYVARSGIAGMCSIAVGLAVYAACYQNKFLNCPATTTINGKTCTLQSPGHKYNQIQICGTGMGHEDTAEIEYCPYICPGSEDPQWGFEFDTECIESDSCEMPSCGGSWSGGVRVRERVGDNRIRSGCSPTAPSATTAWPIESSARRKCEERRVIAQALRYPRIDEHRSARRQTHPQVCSITRGQPLDSFLLPLCATLIWLRGSALF